MVDRFETDGVPGPDMVMEAAKLCKAVYSDAPQAEGWEPITVSELDLPEGYSPNGLFVNRNAAAFVSETEIDGEKVLAVAFRGSDDWRDWLDNLFGIDAHFKHLEPLLEAIEKYAQGRGVDRVVATGQSLGGAMVEAYMHRRRVADPSPPKLSGITFGTPGILARPESYDPRVLSFRHARDAVPWLGRSRRYRTHGSEVSVRYSDDRYRWRRFAAHEAAAYVRTIARLHQSGALPELIRKAVASPARLDVDVDVSPGSGVRVWARDDRSAEPEALDTEEGPLARAAALSSAPASAATLGA